MSANAPTGYVLHEARDIVIIATLHSENSKTGDMVQVWILARHISPVEAIRSGQDDKICFDCVHRGSDGFKDRTCYVQMKAPLGIWGAYQRGRYPHLDTLDYARIFTGRAVRFGAYGDPVLIPLSIVKRIAKLTSKHTGYTHQWKQPRFAAFKRFIMASCDSEQDYIAAKTAGWRTFRVRSENAVVLTWEIACPASEEAGKRTQCIKCGLCNGSTGICDPRKDISIIVHGAQSKNFVSIDSIGRKAS